MKLSNQMLGAVFLASILLSQVAWAGGESGGGGNVAELEFQTIGQLLSHKLTDNPKPFANAVTNTTVRGSTEPLTKDGRPVDARNFPGEHRIVFSLNSWDVLGALGKIGLVYHEYLGIAGVERDMYTASSQLRDFLTVADIQNIAGNAYKSSRKLKARCKITMADEQTVVEVPEWSGVQSEGGFHFTQLLMIGSPQGPIAYDFSQTFDRNDPMVQIYKSNYDSGSNGFAFSDDRVFGHLPLTYSDKEQGVLIICE